MLSFSSWSRRVKSSAKRPLRKARWTTRLNLNVSRRRLPWSAHVRICALALNDIGVSARITYSNGKRWGFTALQCKRRQGFCAHSFRRSLVPREWTTNEPSRRMNARLGIRRCHQTFDPRMSSRCIFPLKPIIYSTFIDHIPSAHSRLSLSPTLTTWWIFGNIQLHPGPLESCTKRLHYAT